MKVNSRTGSSLQPHVAREHLKCGQWKRSEFILLNFKIEAV